MKPCWRCGRRHNRRECPALRKLCWACNDAGHFQKFCPNRPPLPRQQNLPKGLETFEEISAALERLEIKAQLRRQQKLEGLSSTDSKRLREIRVAYDRLKSKTQLKKQQGLEVPSGTHDQYSDSDNDLEDTNQRFEVKVLKAETNPKSENLSDSDSAKDTETDTETKTEDSFSSDSISSSDSEYSISSDNTDTRISPDISDSNDDENFSNDN